MEPWLVIGGISAAMIGLAGWTGMNDEMGKHKLRNAFSSITVLVVVAVVLVVVLWVSRSN